MDADLKRRWVEALRSGEYEQGQKVLRTEDNRYCCLGVLCDIVADGWERDEEFQEWRFVSEGHDSVIDLPKPLRQRAGLHSGEAARAAELNDDGASFAEIADWIETNVGVSA